MGTTSPAFGANALTLSGVNVVATAPYRTGRSYLAAPPTAAPTSTNTNTLTTDTVYGVIAPVNSQVTVTGMSFRTSSSNASSGAAVKFAIYALDPVTGLPTNRLAQTTTGVSVTNSATSTTFNADFSSPVTLNPGVYLFCLLPTATTTAARSSTYSSVNPWYTVTGATTAANLLAGTLIMGYKTADGAVSYAGNFPDTFGTATAITSLAASSAQQVLGLAFTVQ